MLSNAAHPAADRRPVQVATDGERIHPELPLEFIALVAPVIVAGVAAVRAAAYSYVTTPIRSATSPRSSACSSAWSLAERFPVPVEGMDAGGVTLGFVFAVAGNLLFGWQAGVMIVRRRPGGDAPRRAPAAPARRLQRLDVRARGARRRPGDRAPFSEARSGPARAARRSAHSSTTGWSISSSISAVLVARRPASRSSS